MYRPRQSRSHRLGVRFALARPNISFLSISSISRTVTFMLACNRSCSIRRLRTRRSSRGDKLASARSEVLRNSIRSIFVRGRRTRRCLRGEWSLAMLAQPFACDSDRANGAEGSTYFRSTRISQEAVFRHSDIPLLDGARRVSSVHWLYSRAAQLECNESKELPLSSRWAYLCRWRMTGVAPQPADHQQLHMPARSVEFSWTCKTQTYPHSLAASVRSTIRHTTAGTSSSPSSSPCIARNAPFPRQRRNAQRSAPNCTGRTV